jgi:hypothetical protein
VQVSIDTAVQNCEVKFRGGGSLTSVVSLIHGLFDIWYVGGRLAQMLIVMVEPAWLGSVSIRKGKLGSEELCVVFVRRWPYVFVFIVYIGWCICGVCGLCSPHAANKPTQ